VQLTVAVCLLHNTHRRLHTGHVLTDGMDFFWRMNKIHGECG
jgi:hypothetical protein